MSKILIVSDDESTGCYFQKLFSKSGFYTAVVSNCGGMVKFCQQHSPDLIFIDMDEVGDDVWSSVQAVRTIRNLANVAVLGMAVVATGETIQKAKDFGFCGLMPKSTESETMINAIESIMIETKRNQQTTTSNGLARLKELADEVNSVTGKLKQNEREFGSDGPELFAYISGSGDDISKKLSELAEGDLTDKDLRHDFRNMIGSVTGFSELLLMETTLSPESRQGFTRLRECSAEFVALLDQQKAVAGQ